MTSLIPILLARLKTPLRCSTTKFNPNPLYFEDLKQNNFYIGIPNVVELFR